jgi:N-methylhydantoinase B
LGSSGGAGGPHADGWLQYPHAGNGGMAFLDSVELAELYQPIVVHSRRVLADTEGAGRHRGAPAKQVEFGPAGGRLTVAFVADGVVQTPQGARGGSGSSGSRHWLRGGDGTARPVPSCGAVTIEPGETLVSITSGGGGYGPASAREPERVAHDVAEGWVSRERAERVYRVALDEHGEVDRELTAQLRSERIDGIG